MRNVLKTGAILLVVPSFLFLAGCASKDDLTPLRADIAKAQSTAQSADQKASAAADQASKAAAAAQQAADAANKAAAAAQAAADEAKQTSERANVAMQKKLRK